jgi:hypothetical protein
MQYLTVPVWFSRFLADVLRLGSSSNLLVLVSRVSLLYVQCPAAAP